MHYITEQNFVAVCREMADAVAARSNLDVAVVNQIESILGLDVSTAEDRSFGVRAVANELVLMARRAAKSASSVATADAIKVLDTAQCVIIAQDAPQVFDFARVERIAAKAYAKGVASATATASA